MTEFEHVTQILKRAESGDPSAAEALLPIVYEELRKLAAARLAHERPGQTLQATALVHEAWLRMVNVDSVQQWSSRGHFFGAAAEAMRRILVDNARRRKRLKHGGDRQRISLELEDFATSSDDDLLESLDNALRRFEEVDPTACELVKLRYFAGISLQDASSALDVPRRTVDRLWAYAKTWLLREIQREADGGG